jgi:hypothetical protein
VTVTLQNELAGLPDAPDIPARCLAIKAAWQAAVFADVSDACLQRYFTFHLEGLTKLSGALPLVAGELAIHLIEHYATYLNENTILARALYPPILPPDPMRCEGLRDYISQMKTGAQFTLRSLNYYARFCEQLQDAENMDEILLDLNFNHLAYFAWRQQQIRQAANSLDNPARLRYLQSLRSELLARPVPNGVIYHPDWPPLATMLVNWLREEIGTIPVEEPGQKLGLNLSVAQLACLLKLLYDQGVFTTENFSDILRFFAAHFRSKRRENISYGGLSKESYSTGQVTAAVLRDKFAQMIKKIDRHFFPG